MAKIVWTVRKKVAIAVAHAAVAVLLLIAVILILRNNEVEHKAAIVTNGLECSEIGSNILKNNGSIADAAIAAMLCEGVTCPQSTGLGGGFVMTLYRKSENKVETLIARDVAPLAATENMFVNISVTGGKAVAVPGELMGYWELHQKYGNLPWSQLFDPTIELCRKGHVVSPYLAGILSRNKEVVLKSPTLSAIYIDPKTNDVYKEGDLVKRNKLADTLEIIKKEGVGAIYNNGSIGRMMIEDIQKEGGIMTMEDLSSYKVRWEEPISATLKDKKTLHTVPLPGSGALVAFIMNVLDDYLPEGYSTQSLQRIAEAYKFAYAKRSDLGDARFVDVMKVVQNLTSIEFAKEIRSQIEDMKTYPKYEHYGANFSSTDDHGTANINILAPNGDAISVTGTINTLFGSKFVSKQTGIIMNDGMDDFAVPGKNNAYGIPPSPANFIRPKKMPLSSMCPSILLDENRNVELIVGAAGGSKITSSVAYVLLRYLYFKEPIEVAVKAPRIHHQLVPMRLEYEEGFSEEIINALRSYGHEMYPTKSDSGFASLTAIGRNGKQLIPVFDHRRRGSLAVF